MFDDGIKDITEKEFNAIREHIKRKYGISLGDEKRTLVYSRLRTVLREHGFRDFTQYFDYLLKDKTGAAERVFIDKISTNHTFFMREPDHFDFFRDTVLPYIEQNVKNKDLRLWCAASSSGEEPYTLQMIIQDYFDGKGWDTKTLATDVSSTVLDKAVRGVYTNESLAPLPEHWRKKYFVKRDSDTSIVTDELKKQIIFRKFNLMDETFPFKKPFQVVFCRNVMIYFETETRDALVSKIYDLTEPGGYLFIGHSESLSNSPTKFKYVMPAVYRK